MTVSGLLITAEVNAKPSYSASFSTQVESPALIMCSSQLFFTPLALFFIILLEVLLVSSHPISQAL